MKRQLGVVMDPIESISYQKDSTLAMLWEAKKRGFTLFYFEQKDLFIQNGIAYGRAREIDVHTNPSQWFTVIKTTVMPLADCDIILMRKDPPFNREYIYTTYILEMAERAGALVANKPQSLRDANEKIFATHFPTCSPATLVTRDIKMLFEFWQEHGEIVCKPLDAMGGASIFRLAKNDVNARVVFETLTHNETAYMMAQAFIPAIAQGDKRILMINGEPVPYALARIPKEGEWRGNLAAGAKGMAQALSDRDLWIAEQVGPTLKEKGLYFVGLDVIGEYLTEVNVTSPTCIRELDEQCQLNIASMLFDCLEQVVR